MLAVLGFVIILLPGLSSQALGDHQKHTLPYAWLLSAIMVAVGCVACRLFEKNKETAFLHYSIFYPIQFRNVCRAGFPQHATECVQGQQTAIPLQGTASAGFAVFRNLRP